MTEMARMKAEYDYNTHMEEWFEDGVEVGDAIAVARLTATMRALGTTEDQIQNTITGQW